MIDYSEEVKRLLPCWCEYEHTLGCPQCEFGPALAAALAAAEAKGAELWRNECQKICDALADLAGVPRDPAPGWQNCIAKLKRSEQP